MLLKSTKASIFAVFADADGSSATYAERLLALGVGDRATAKPLVLEWALKKHPTPMKQGLQGLTFVKRDTATERTMNRVLALCFPRVDAPKPKTNNKSDPVELLLKKYKALTSAQKRRFMNNA